MNHTTRRHERVPERADAIRSRRQDNSPQPLATTRGGSRRGRLAFTLALAVVVAGLAFLRLAPGASPSEILVHPTVGALPGLGLGNLPIPSIGAATPAEDESGELREPVSPFDTDVPAIARLDADLLLAVQSAARDAAADGVPMHVTSGWRSSAYQQRLLDEAIDEYGSLQEALRYVATPEVSAHVTGDAVDIGPTEADDWLQRHGARYGLCQVYANEIWHFELRTTPGGRCPRMVADASQ